MEYFAGLDVSMAETHVCVMNREGDVMHEIKGRRRLPTSQPRSRNYRPVGASCSRPAGWRRCCTMA